MSDFTRMTVARLKKLQRSFRKLHRQQPKFNVFCVWVHDESCRNKFSSDDADLVLRDWHWCDTAECMRRYSCRYQEGYVHVANSPESSGKEYELQRKLMDILNRFPPFAQGYKLPEWANAWSADGGWGDWDGLALTAACFGLEYRETLIDVIKCDIKAVRRKQWHSSSHPLGPNSSRYYCEIRFNDESADPIHAREYTPERKHCLDLLCKSAVSIVVVRGVFDAAAKLAEAAVCRLTGAREAAATAAGHGKPVAPPDGPQKVGFTFWWKGISVDLEPKPFELLRYVWETPGRTVTQDDAHDQIWDGAPGDSSLKNAQAKINTALDEVSCPMALRIKQGTISITI